MLKVVIVESPSKIKSIEKYLDNKYKVLASYGHVRDLAPKNGSVQPDNNFQMVWEVDKDSLNHVESIASAIRGAQELILATDPDREGEAISWHILQILNERNVLKNLTVKRVIFHEITKQAVLKAFESPRSIRQDLVNAYLARRALDYLYGFTLSPVLWRKLPGSRSAGRVQSVALRLVADREAEIEAFVPEEYWTIHGFFKKSELESKLTHIDGKKIEKLDIKNGEDAEKIVSAAKPKDYLIKDIQKKEVNRNPSAAFITSTLQQDASRKLGFSPSRTMQVAQKLYEGIKIGREVVGLITYMRTDNIQMSQEAINAARLYIGTQYGEKYLPESPRVFKNKSKNAQEAHEAIRPTNMELSPQILQKDLTIEQYKLYSLIWTRALASQMKSAIFEQQSIDISSQDNAFVFRATGSRMVFDGFLKVYQEGREIDDSDADGASKMLPVVHVGEKVDLTKIVPEQHFTQPPPHYSEASLVQKMDELGIGRPSTYAGILRVLQERKYVALENRQLICQDRGRLVTTFLKRHFPKYIEFDFTANLELQLDDVSNGDKDWHQVTRTFWEGFKSTVDDTQDLKITDVLNELEEDLSYFLFPTGDRHCPSCQSGTLRLKLGKFGGFLGCDRYPDCKYIKNLNNMDAEGDAPEEIENTVIGKDPSTQQEIVLKSGPYGPYLEWVGSTSDTVDESKTMKKKKVATVEAKSTKKKKVKALKPKRVSIPKGMPVESVDLAKAIFLGSLPKELGVNEDNLPVAVGIGRFGPYVRYGDQFVSIPKRFDIFKITLAECLDLIKEKESKPKRPTTGARSFKRRKGSS